MSSNLTGAQHLSGRKKNSAPHWIPIVLYYICPYKNSGVMKSIPAKRVYGINIQYDSIPSIERMLLCFFTGSNSHNHPIAFSFKQSIL